MRSLLFTEPVDFLIGNTYGKYLERDTGTPLIRIGFPIFDRHHHHRYPVWGYQGAHERAGQLLDKIFDEMDRNTNVVGEVRLQLRHHPLNRIGVASLPPRRSRHPDDARRALNAIAAILGQGGQRQGRGADPAIGAPFGLSLTSAWTSAWAPIPLRRSNDTLANKIQEVFNEPGCDKNQAKSEKERKKGCTKQLQPGAAAGGCAFDGAKIALQPITDVAHLVHGPIACEGNSWDNRGAKSSGSQLYRTGFTTDINENDIVFGGEKRLYKSIKEIIEKYDPPAVFVYQTCVPAMIGDDINAVCKAAAAEIRQARASRSMSPGFVGPKNLGNKLAGEAMLDHVIGTQEPEYTTPYDINIIGEYNLSGELWQVKPLLDELGIRILACISGDAQISRGGLVAPRPRRDDGLLQGDDQCRPQDGGALRNPLLRRLVLRHRAT